VVLLRLFGKVRAIARAATALHLDFARPGLVGPNFRNLLEAARQALQELAVECLGRRGQGVKAPQTGFAGLHQPGPAEVSEVLRSFGLFDAQNGNDVANAALATLEEV
jgi:hypothetical protein